MSRPLLLFCLACAAFGSAASAQSAATFDPSIPRSLSPEEKQRILDKGNEASAEAALTTALGGVSRLPIHGEVGAVIGSGGMAGVFGTAAVPLGENGAAIISFEDFRSGSLRRR